MRVYTTMTRQKVFRLLGRGWKLSPDLYHAVYTIKSRWYEVCKDGEYLDGVAYDPYF